MEKEDIEYFDSWANSFKKCSPAKVMHALLYGIWICANHDPEDIYLSYPRLLTRIGHPDNAKEFGSCPFEFALDDTEDNEDGKVINKHRDIEYFGITWALDKYEMRKAITQRGLEMAKEYKITEDDIKSLVIKYGFSTGYRCETDQKMYHDFITNHVADPKFWWGQPEHQYFQISQREFSVIRAAFCPNLYHSYNWCDNLDKAGITAEQIKFYEDLTGDIVKL